MTCSFIEVCSRGNYLSIGLYGVVLFTRVNKLFQELLRCNISSLLKGLVCCLPLLVLFICECLQYFHGVLSCVDLLLLLNLLDQVASFLAQLIIVGMHCLLVHLHVTFELLCCLDVVFGELQGLVFDAGLDLADVVDSVARAYRVLCELLI